MVDEKETNEEVIPDNRRWYVVRTKAGDEGRAEKNLLNREIETFLPLEVALP